MYRDVTSYHGARAVCSWLLSSGRIADHGLILPAWRCRLNDYHAYLIERFWELFFREVWNRFDATDCRDLCLALDMIGCPEYLDLVRPTPAKTAPAVGTAKQGTEVAVEVKLNSSVALTETAITEPTRLRISKHLRAEVNSLEPGEFFWREGERRFWWIDKVLLVFGDLATLIEAVWAMTYRQDIAEYEEREKSKIHVISAGTVEKRLTGMDVWEDWDESQEEPADIDEDRLATHVADCVARTGTKEDSV